MICILWYRSRNTNAYSIRNPMVLSINIGHYDEHPKNPGITAHCPDLNGIDNDYKHMRQLCDALKYELYPKPAKYYWTQNEIIRFLGESAAKLEQKVLDDQDNKNTKSRYDGLFVVVSCHGWNNSIITSDYQLITKQAIHNIFSWKHPKIRSIPRVFVFDCCDGDQERDLDWAPESVDEKESDDIVGKNFGIDDIDLSSQDTLVWKRDQDNPDYRLCLIHAANPGFQAKMSSETGSYLVTSMTNKMIENVNNKNCCSKFKFFGEIIDEIQQDLHDKGKQQVTFSFNNHTRKLKFRKNKNVSMNHNKETVPLTEI